MRGAISMNVPGNGEICLQYTWECISNNSGITRSKSSNQHTGITTATTTFSVRVRAAKAAGIINNNNDDISNDLQNINIAFSAVCKTKYN